MPAKAVVLAEFNAPLRLLDRAIPEPMAGAVIVDVLYSGICGTDVHLHSGHMDIPIPLVLGHEAVGRVSALGPDVDTDSLGQAVAVGDLIGWASNIPCGECRACEASEVTLCRRRRVYGINQAWDEWPHLSGGWAEAIYLQPGSTFAKLPDALRPLDVIALGCAGPTVVHGLDQLGGVENASVIVQGVGPVGLAAALFARRRGAARVVIIGGPSERIELVRELGVADAYIDLDRMTDAPRRAELARKLIDDDRGADAVIECTGSPRAVAEGIDLSRPGGRYLVLGQYTDRGAAAINPHHITRKQLAVLGSWAFSPRDYLAYLDSLPDLLELVDLTRLVRVFPLSEAEGALNEVRHGRVLKAALATPAGLRLLAAEAPS